MGIALKGIELSVAMGINRALIAIARKKGHIQTNEDGLFEIDDHKNKLWIKGQFSNGYVFDMNRLEISKANKEMNKPIPKEKRIIPKKVVIEYQSVKPSHSKNNFVKQSLEQQIKEESGRSQLTPKGKANNTREFKEKNDAKSNSIFVRDENDDLRDEKLALEVEKLKNSDKLEKLKIAKLEGELLPVDAVETIFLWAVEQFKKTYEQDIDNIANIFIKILGGEQSHFIEIKKMQMEALCEIGKTYKESLISGLQNQISLYTEVRGRGERK